MAGTEDIGKIVSLIMQNPGLIAEISGLINASDNGKKEAESSDMTGTVVNKTAVVADEMPEKAEAVSARAEPARRGGAVPRHELLSAMKPYLSEKRREAIDSLEAIAGIIDTVRRVR